MSNPGPGFSIVKSVLHPTDFSESYIDAVANQTSLIKEVHPDESVRTAAEKMSQKADAFNADVSLNRAVYDAIAALDLAGTDAETRYITADKMVGSGKNASMFIDRIVEASKAMAAKEYQTLLAKVVGRFYLDMHPRW